MRTNVMKRSIAPKTDRVNHEGFPTYDRPVEERVIQVLMTGTPTNTFYLDKDENVDLVIDTLKECKDPEYLAKAILYARRYGYMRMAPIVGLVYLSTFENKSYFRAIASEVCRNPHDWKNFIDTVQSKRVRQGFGRAIKTEMNDATMHLSTYHAIKYPTDVKDMINLARPAEGINPDVINYIKKGTMSKEDGTMVQVAKFLRAKSPNTVAKIIREGRLPYEFVTGSMSVFKTKNKDFDDKPVWEALLYTAPYMNLLRNLNNFTKYGVFDNQGNLDYAVNTLTNPDNIRKSMILPFRYYIAYKNLKGGDLKSTTLRYALTKALYTSFDSVPEINGKVAICPDVSGSMSTRPVSGYTDLQCHEIAALFSMVLKSKSRDNILLPFDDEVKFDTAEAVKNGDIFNCIEEFANGGGTSLSAPVEYLLSNRIKVDVIVGFTDYEEWVGRSFINAYLDYKQKVNLKVRACLVGLAPNRVAPAPPEFKDVKLIYGWSDAAVKMIAIPDTQVDVVKDLNLPV